MIIGRLGRMAYINTLPIDWGLLNGRLGKSVMLQSGTPTTLNWLLAEGLLDLSPVSSIAAAERADEWMVLDGLCIGCKGEVGSVILSSDRPVEALDGKTISVTKASATAAGLLEILLAKHWQVKTNLVRKDTDTGARLLIGDQALKTAQSGLSEFVYDLGAAWREFTGHDFVFGLWCVRRDFAKAYPERTAAVYHLLQASRALARANAAQVVTDASGITQLTEETIEAYYRKLVYTLDNGLWEGLRHFLRLAGYEPDKLRVFREGCHERRDSAASLEREPRGPGVCPHLTAAPIHATS